MDTTRLRFGELVAAGSAVLLFIFMTFFKWYGVDFPGGPVGEAAEEAADNLNIRTNFNAWQSFGFIDIILFLTILAAIAMAVLSMLQRSVALPVTASVIVTGLAALSTLLLIIRIINPPGQDFGGLSGVDVDLERNIGLFLGFLATLGILLGGFLSMREEGAGIPGKGGGAVGPGTGPGAGAGPGAPAEPAPPPAAPPPGAPPPGAGPGSTPPPSGPPPSSPGGPPTSGA
jgi:hypothetical protein